MSQSPPASFIARRDRIPLGQKIAYGTGQVANIILALSVVNLAPFVLTVELGVGAFWVGLAMGVARVWDAFTDPLVGYWSDQTRSRWGRRKPFLFVGAITVALCLALMWQLPRGWSETAYFWFFLLMSLPFYLAYTVYATPFVALGYELTPDYHERTRLMGAMNLIGGLASLPMAWLFAITQWEGFEDGVQGARVLAAGLALLVAALGLVPVFLLRDPTAARFAPGAARERGGLGFFAGMKVTLRNRNFRRLCLATFAFFPGMILVQNLSSFLVIYYLYAGDKAAASVLIGWSGTLASVLGLLFVPVVTWLGTHLGKRSAFIVCAAAALAGCLLKWVSYVPELPWLNLLPGPFIGLGFAALWVLMSSMMADVCDEDELHTGERREGAYGAIFWWIVKLGLSAALAASGLLLELTGFDEALGGAQSERTILLMRVADMLLPAVFVTTAILFVRRFSLTEARCGEIRSELERRRAAGRDGATAEKEVAGAA